MPQNKCIHGLIMNSKLNNNCPISTQQIKTKLTRYNKTNNKPKKTTIK